MPARFPEADLDREAREEALRASGGEWISRKGDVVVSGISGRFPRCSGTDEFEEALFAGVDLVTDEESRWPKGERRFSREDAGRGSPIGTTIDRFLFFFCVDFEKGDDNKGSSRIE